MAAKNQSAATLQPLAAYQAADPAAFVELYATPLNAYCREVVKQMGYLDNQGVALDDDGGTVNKVHIDHLFVFPEASKARISPEALAAQEVDPRNTAQQRHNTINIARLIAVQPRLTLLGDPGVGKTTLLQWLLCSLCHWSDNFAKKRIGHYFPLLLTVRKLPETVYQQPISNAKFIQCIFTSQGDVLAAKTKIAGFYGSLGRLLKNGQVLLLVDGLDEIAPQQSAWLSQQLRQLITEFPQLRMLLTSRVVGFSGATFWQVEPLNEQSEPQFMATDTIDAAAAANLPVAYYVAPFQPQQREAFAKNWAAIYITDDSQRQKFISEIASISRQNLQLNSLSRIPVLLSMICFIQWRRGELPNGRAELYQRIVETYLVAMDRARSIKQELSNEYDYQDIKNWLAKLALQMQCGKLLLPSGAVANLTDIDFDKWLNKKPAIQAERILQLTETQLSEFLQIQLFEVVGREKLAEHAQHLIHYIKTRTGFLIPRGQIDGEEYYGFSHLSFLEYFAAYAIAHGMGDRKPPRNYLATLDSSAWAEIWQLVFEELSLTPGLSRQKSEKKLEWLYPKELGLFAGHNSRFAVNHWLLYLKIIANPAVKLAASSRTQLRIAACVAYCVDVDVDFDFSFIFGFGFAPLIELLNDSFQRYQSEIITKLKARDLDEKLTRLNLTSIQLSDYTWLADLSHLVDLNLGSAAVGDSAFISQLTKLEILTLNRTQVMDLTPLAQLTGLNTLKFSHTQVTDLTPLAQLTGLKELDFSGTQVTDLTPLAQLTGLKSLSLNSTQVTDLTPLAQLTDLKELYFSDTQVTDLTPLAQLTGLKTLNCSATQVTDLTPLAQLTGLNTLNCAQTPVTDLTPLAQLTGLKILHCTNTQVTDIKPLANLSQLELLLLHQTPVADFTPLLSMKKLRYLRCDNTLDPEIEQQLQQRGVNMHTFFYNAPNPNLTPTTLTLKLNHLGFG